MEDFLTYSIVISAGGLILSGTSTGSWWKLVLGVTMLIVAIPAGKYLAYKVEPRMNNTERKRAEKAARKAAEKERRESPEQTGFEYLRATFQFAGHIAHADGVLCDNELQHFYSTCTRLQLSPQQITAVRDYFDEGRSEQFNAREALDRFVNNCGHISVLCENFLQTQFTFAEASGNVTLPELAILQRISQHLNAGEAYQNLLSEYRIDIEKKAEQIEQQRLDELRRERDKKREAEENARIEAEQQRAKAEKLEKLTPAQRELRLAFAVLGIKATKDKTTIKRAYREQIKRHHPDYLLSQGYPEELLAEATERSVKINKAYRLLKTRIGFT